MDPWCSDFSFIDIGDVDETSHQGARWWRGKTWVNLGCNKSGVPFVLLSYYIAILAFYTPPYIAILDVRIIEYWAQPLGSGSISKGSNTVR